MSGNEIGREMIRGIEKGNGNSMAIHVVNNRRYFFYYARGDNIISLHIYES